MKTKFIFVTTPAITIKVGEEKNKKNLASHTISKLSFENFNLDFSPSIIEVFRPGSTLQDCEKYFLSQNLVRQSSHEFPFSGKTKSLPAPLKILLQNNFHSAELRKNFTTNLTSSTTKHSVGVSRQHFHSLKTGSCSKNVWRRSRHHLHVRVTNIRHSVRWNSHTRARAAHA